MDDPSSHPETFPTEQDQEGERQRLFSIIEDLVRWENSTNEPVLQAARDEISRSVGEDAPAILDPFCGGGSIPLEAQRLGIAAYASDLNPVAVLITKALIEFPSKAADLPPVNPESRAKLDFDREWKGAWGLAEDIRYYARWTLQESEKRIGNLYPKAKLPKGLGGGEATVTAWIWARTVTCPNPACAKSTPLVSKWWLSKKRGRRFWIEPAIDRRGDEVRFTVRGGDGSPRNGNVARSGATCLICDNPIALSYVRAEGVSGRLGWALTALAVSAGGRKAYVDPDGDQTDWALVERTAPEGPMAELPTQALGFRVQAYGMTKHADLYLPRQLAALGTFSDLVMRVRERVSLDAAETDRSEDYADAVATYIALAVDKAADFGNVICTWNPENENVRQLFSKQAIQMSWDVAEANPLAGGLSISALADGIAQAVEGLAPKGLGRTAQVDAAASASFADGHPIICTDPPYYDNIGYADLSDFFYVWLRRALGRVYPDLFSTLLTPKSQELVANPFRFTGGRKEAEAFFENGLRATFEELVRVQHPEFPLTVFYAFKQSEVSDDNVNGGRARASTGWETMLEGLLGAGTRIAKRRTRHQRPGFIDRSRLPPSTRGFSNGHPPGVHVGAEEGASSSSQTTPACKYRSCRLSPSRDWPGHGGVFSLLAGS